MKIHDNEPENASEEGSEGNEDGAKRIEDRGSLSRDSMNDNDPPVIIDGGSKSGSRSGA